MCSSKLIIRANISDFVTLSTNSKAMQSTFPASIDAEFQVTSHRSDNFGEYVRAQRKPLKADSVQIRAMCRTSLFLTNVAGAIEMAGSTSSRSPAFVPGRFCFSSGRDGKTKYRVPREFLPPFVSLIAHRISAIQEVWVEREAWEQPPLLGRESLACRHSARGSLEFPGQET